MVQRSSANAQIHRIPSASDQSSKGNVKHVLTANAHCQSQTNTARRMSNTYELRTRKHTRFGQPRINPAIIMQCQTRTPYERANTRDSVSVRSTDSVSLKSTQQGECQARTGYDCTSTWDEIQSALDQSNKENVKHVRTANVETHGTLSASNQPSKENVKHVRATNAHMRFSQPRINPARKCQARTSWECANTRDSISLKSTQQGKCQACTNYKSTSTRDSFSLRSTQQTKCQARTICERGNTWDSVSFKSTQQGKCQARTSWECANTRDSVSLGST